MKRLLPILLLPLLSFSQQNNPINNISLNLTSLDDIKEDENNIPTEEIKTFVDVFDTVRQNYIETIRNQELMENAIRGMLSRLDAHSTYLNPEELEAFNRENSGDFAGVGIILDIKDGLLQIVSTLEGSPAARAGLQSGDIISQINGQNIYEFNLDESSKLLEGELGSELKLLIQRDNNILTFNLVREIINANNVSSRMLTDDFAYLRLNRFQDNSAELLIKELELLNVKYKIKGAILDLRNNPGGYLESALAIADLFLSEGTIVSVRERNEDENKIYKAQDKDILNGASLIVLIDAGSASAAEIVAGALQDNKRALIVGERSFGKGSVQTIIHLPHGGALKLTTARYFTPSGRSIQAEGITPDVQLQNLMVKHKITSNENIRESALPYHLRSFNETLAPSEDSQGIALAEQDFALFEALNLLSALSIFKQ